MSVFRKVHCLFEQSGTFKKEFKKLGYEAYDYDIENQFEETDFQIDLFNEIDSCVQQEPSIFDTFTHDDLLLAFFPCVRFTEQVLLVFTGNHVHNWDLQKRLERSKELGIEQGKFYELFCNLFLICLERNLRLIVENPYNHRSYLTLHFPLHPDLIDYDRRLLGDKFKKPTQYWFFNVPLLNNKIDYVQQFIFGDRFPPLAKPIKRVHGIERSLIEPKYAENFIKKYVIRD